MYDNKAEPLQVCYRKKSHTYFVIMIIILISFRLNNFDIEYYSFFQKIKEDRWYIQCFEPGAFWPVWTKLGIVNDIKKNLQRNYTSLAV